MTKLPELSIVIPLFNEAAILPHLFSKLKTTQKILPKNTEVIFVDDGSTDETFSSLLRKNLTYKKRVIKLSRNFGHQAALLAGLEKANGKIVVTIDADLQHPLELIPKMIAAHKKGIDIVMTQRIDGKVTSLAKKQTAHFFYQILNSISEQKITHNSSDFRSLNRKSLQALLSLPEKRKFLRGMVQWIGYSSITLPFFVQKRAGGQSKYSWSKMFRLAVEGITSFSTAPLYLSAFFGLILFLLAFIYAVYVVYAKFFFGQIVQGWASVVFVQLVIGGFFSLFLGLAGLYIAAIYDEVKNRPNYLISEEIFE